MMECHRADFVGTHQNSWYLRLYAAQVVALTQSKPGTTQIDAETAHDGNERSFDMWEGRRVNSGECSSESQARVDSVLRRFALSDFLFLR